jgi:hypothetical protein
MSMEYIRKTYRVPAQRGGRVRFNGYDGPLDGTIKSADGQYLRVQFDGQKRPVTLHPTWKVEYLSQRT